MSERGLSSLAADPPTTAVGAWPGLAPRLVAAAGGGADLDAYRAAGGGAARSADPAHLRAQIAASGLRGRGGAGFPTGTKLAAVATRPGPRHVVANGDEGEPASVKDRWLLRNRPHLVLDGLLLAVHAAAAAGAHVVVSDPVSEAAVEVAISQRPDAPVAIEVVRVPKTYVAGEETAAVRAVGGGPALPVAKPPRPFEAGVAGEPTAVLNVETLANLPGIASRGVAWFRSLGTEGSPGTALLTVSGACARPGLYEVPLGLRLRDAIGATAGFAEGPVRGVLLAGFFGGVLAPAVLDVVLDHEALRAAGAALGCGAIVLLGPRDCPVGAAADVMAFFARESSGQCGPCVRGTAAMAAALDALARGHADGAATERLAGWSTSLRGRGACGLLDAAAGLAGVLLREFPDDVRAHLAGTCRDCVGCAPGPDRFVVPVPVVP